MRDAVGNSPPVSGDGRGSSDCCTTVQVRQHKKKRICIQNIRPRIKKNALCSSMIVSYMVPQKVSSGIKNKVNEEGGKRQQKKRKPKV